jgi:conjugal transfer mating pair stabilization protein TraG
LARRDGDVAVGLLQVSLKRHGQRVGDPAGLLDPAVNLTVAAAALTEAIGTAGGDVVLGVGRYRYPEDDTAARSYGQRVLALRDALRRRAPQGDAGDLLDLWRGNAVLDLVAGPESRGNYNAWYRAANQHAVQLAELTLAEVRALQRRLVRENGGSAIGRYQIIDDTLDGLMLRMGLTGKERFTPALQDRMAMWLAREAGLEAWLSGALTDARFAANLARVWAGLPADGSGRSHYAGIAGNRAGVGWRTVVAALRHIRFDGIRQQ